MTDTNKLKELAERARDKGDWYKASSVDAFPEFHVDQEFMVATSPEVVLWLIAEVERLRSRLEIDERIPHDGIACRDETIKGLDEKCYKLKAENEALRKFSAEAYQVLGALDAPENVLDNASDAANGVPLRHETLLPFFVEDYEELRKDATRYRWLRDNCTRQWDVMYRDIEVVIKGDGADDCEDLDGIIDAALEGATQ
ncbi:hypothetical protein [Pseudomonas aeruginosa]|uniref:hypothetical protein n=1 Tax=Pseudomonas aeruginosa TaxID=287 RepID=UPI001CD2FCF3|nr:hypothetical protein [Pseudomonas aeruginosa]